MYPEWFNKRSVQTDGECALCSQPRLFYLEQSKTAVFFPSARTCSEAIDRWAPVGPNLRLKDSAKEHQVLSTERAGGKILLYRIKGTLANAFAAAYGRSMDKIVCIRLEFRLFA